MIPVERKGYVCGGILVVVFFVLAAANLLLGSVDIPAGAVWGALTGGTGENEAWSFIVWESRVPLCVTAWCCGAALAASGLMLQTVFNNPLADPSILGISSGASLGVALVMMAGGGIVSAGTISFSGFKMYGISTCQTVTQLNHAVIFIVYRLVQLGLYAP